MLERLADSAFGDAAQVFKNIMIKLVNADTIFTCRFL